MKIKLTLIIRLLIILSILLAVACTTTNEIEPIQPSESGSEVEIVENKSTPDILVSEVIDQESKGEPKATSMTEDFVIKETAQRTDVLPISQESGLPIEKADSRDPDVPIEMANIEIVPEDSRSPDGIVEELVASPSLPIVSADVIKPVSDPIIQEPTVDPVSTVSVAAIERTTMPPNLFFFGILAILVIVLVLLANRNAKLKQALEFEQNRILVLGISGIESAHKQKQELEITIARIESQLIVLKEKWVNLKGEKGSLEENCSKLEKRIENQKLKLARAKELYSAIEHAVERFHQTDIPAAYYRPLTDQDKVDLDSIAPSVMLNLNYMNYQDLRKEFRANQKQIDALLEDYAQRYSTKANQVIYKLMVISLRSELQNILYNLKHEKLDTALFQVQSLIAKYLVIASDGNQQIAGTMRKFVGELEHLFDNAVRIEYEYYIKKEQAKQEQLALRQQMREEAEERKRLEEQKKQIAFEESKYQAEITKVQELLSLEPEDSPKRVEIMAKLEELNIQLVQVEEKKEEITKLQNGKAGNVYIISNLGSFGDRVFKIGMTRRLNPQERVDELGSASVPFKFDVHSFIFSEDAVGLENELHLRLHARRLNKVNLRKEFFDVSLDELEELVEEINPTAEFNRTMLAEDYNQSLSLGDQEIPLSDSKEGFIDQDDEVIDVEENDNE